ncbi:MAG: hypothetical protein LRY73_16755 [Bacillus sp. (in: Bacteria)]|nr:hypothetical protein [Bacillus sp. (in: firmicutes)]
MKKILLSFLFIVTLFIFLSACQSAEGQVHFETPDSFPLGESVPVTVQLDENHYELDNVFVTGFFEMREMNCVELYVDFEKREDDSFIAFVDFTMAGDWVGEIEITNSSGEKEELVFEFYIDVD